MTATTTTDQLRARARALAALIASLATLVMGLALVAPAQAIFEGQPVSSQAFAGPGGTPWVTALLTPGPGSRYERQFCGGSLVAPDQVLTAAHCVDGTRTSEIEALLGTTDLNRGGELVGVSEVTVFPRYVAADSFGDLALLTLERSTSLETVDLVDTGEHHVGSLGFVAGWGDQVTIKSEESDFPRRLRAAEVPIIADLFCEHGSGDEDPDYDGRVMLCAGYERGHPDTCRGDSGGPLARQAGERWILVGVTSYGQAGCGAIGTYGAYAWVGSPQMRAWLRDRLGF